jgi:hypothetical protein
MMMMIHDDDDRQSLRLFSHIRPHPQILIQWWYDQLLRQPTTKWDQQATWGCRWNSIGTFQNHISNILVWVFFAGNSFCLLFGMFTSVPTISPVVSAHTLILPLNIYLYTSSLLVSPDPFF